MIPEYKWIKEGKDWVRIQIPVNKWKGIPPIEDQIKKPTDNKQALLKKDLTTVLMGSKISTVKQIYIKKPLDEQRLF